MITQADLFKSYAEQNNLYVNLSNVALWFEFGGRQIAKLSLDIVALHAKKQPESKNYSVEDESQQPAIQQFDWRLSGKYKNPFSSHFSQVFISLEEGIFLVGGHGIQHNNLHYNMKTIRPKANLPHEKTFFSAVHYMGRIYTFGGYDAYLKVQLMGCEYYDLKLDRWFNSPIPGSGAPLEYKLH